ncbi:MAG: hypothetical protein NUV47_03575 [Patescibacteria group bacterium]|nr:hypothetical protein [Patescibacteria group bacterium]
MNNKKMPYWLKGGVIGGGVAFVFYLLVSFCFDYFCLVFYIVSPIYPVIFLLNLLAPVFGYSWIFAEVYAPILSIPIWFIIGSLIGAIVGYIKKK